MNSPACLPHDCKYLTLSIIQRMSSKKTKLLRYPPADIVSSLHCKHSTWRRRGNFFGFSCFWRWPQVAFYVFLHSLFICCKQTLQFNSHKMLLNNFVRDATVIRCSIIYLPCFSQARPKALGEVGEWCKIDALRLHYVVINIAAAKHCIPRKKNEKTNSSCRMQ